MGVYLAYSMIKINIIYILGVYHALRYILEVYKTLCGDPMPYAEKRVYYGHISCSRYIMGLYHAYRLILGVYKAYLMIKKCC